MLEAIFAPHEIFAPSQIIPGYIGKVLSMVALICFTLPPTMKLWQHRAHDAETAPQNAESLPMNSFGIWLRGLKIPMFCITFLLVCSFPLRI